MCEVDSQIGRLLNLFAPITANVLIDFDVGICLLNKLTSFRSTISMHPTTTIQENLTDSGVLSMSNNSLSNSFTPSHSKENLGESIICCNNEATFTSISLSNLILAGLARFQLTMLRESQKPVVEAVLSNLDCLVVMPTGGGKSLCYQLPAILQSGVTIVISPLVSLIKDQVTYLKNLGVSELL